MELRFKDLLSFTRAPADKLALYNFLTDILKGVSIKVKLETKLDGTCFRPAKDPVIYEKLF
ncbi:MAG: hypothetical protein QXJ64_03215 [Thermosphaera sp.]